MMQDPPDIMLVVGGYNSSNTNHLAHLCREYTTTFHVKDAECIDTGHRRDPSQAGAGPRHAPEVTDWNWLPPGPLQLGITAGASTPNNEIGKALARILVIRGGGGGAVGARGFILVYTCSARPSAPSAPSATASDSVGCGCMARSISSAVDSRWRAITNSAISSVACGPTMWAPTTSE